MGSSAPPPDLTSRLLRHERLIVFAGVALLALLSWWFVAAGAGMRAMTATMQAPPFGALILMWWLMMVAMMLPSATPAILLYARVRESRGDESSIAQTPVFLAGYLSIWLLFSILAAFAQGLLAGPSMTLGNRWAESALLIAAGVYELTPLKKGCLTRCRSPAELLTRHWRPGWGGAVRLGVLHGADCLGCCWMLMALLFVGGVMNLAWIAALTLLILAEKLVPGGRNVARVTGIALLVWGAATLVA